MNKMNKINNIYGDKGRTLNFSKWYHLRKLLLFNSFICLAFTLFFVASVHFLRNDSTPTHSTLHIQVPKRNQMQLIVVSMKDEYIWMQTFVSKYKLLYSSSHIIIIFFHTSWPFFMMASAKKTNELSYKL